MACAKLKLSMCIFELDIHTCFLFLCLWFLYKSDLRAFITSQTMEKLSEMNTFQAKTPMSGGWIAPEEC